MGVGYVGRRVGVDSDEIVEFGFHILPALNDLVDNPDESPRSDTAALPRNWPLEEL